MVTEGNLICQGAVIPNEVAKGNDLHTLISSMYMHGSIMHLLGNMLFLWIFADNIEATVGNLRFLLFYIGGGVFASFAHIYFNMGASDFTTCCIPCASGQYECGETSTACMGYVPSLGASGAISAVMGAYIVMFPTSKIKVLVIFLLRSVFVSAWIFLGLWFATQLISGLGSMSNISGLGGIAWWAHIGGFVFGLGMGIAFKRFV